MTTKVIQEKVGTIIETISGEATYSHTEIEDRNENWDNHWKTKNGEWVIHRDNEHDIYIIRKKK